MEKMYTVGEIAKELKLPESTASYYLRTFIDFMPIVGEGRRKRYKPEVLEIVAMIRQAFNNHLDQVQINQVLAQKYNVNVEQEKSIDIYNTSLIEQQGLLRQMAAKIRDLESQLGEIKEDINQNRLDTDERDKHLVELMRFMQEQRAKESKTKWEKFKDIFK